MKKLFSLTLLLSFFFSLTYSQNQGGPDSYGYKWKDNTAPAGPVFNWIDISSKGILVTGLGDDNFKGPFNIGFEFPYYWTKAKQFYIGSNGYISLDQGTQISSSAIGFPTIPTADNTNNFIAPLLADMVLDGAGNPAKCYYYTNNVDTLIISFEDVPFWNSTSNFSGNNSFQIILNASDSSITFQYIEQSGTYDPAYNNVPNPVIIGIENINGTIGLQVTNNELPIAPKAIRFDYPDTVTFSIIDVQPNWVNNNNNGGFFLIKNNNSIIDASVSNVGNSNITTPFNVNTQIYASVSGNPSGNSLYDENYSINSINSGQKMNFSYGLIYSPTNSGIYHVITKTQLTSDLIKDNDTIKTELVVIDTSGVQEVIFSYTDSAFEKSFGFGGAAVYYVPPFYPVDINKLIFSLVDNDTSKASNSYTARIWADDSLKNGPGALLYDTTIAQNDVLTLNGSGKIQIINMDSAVTITSGGFYISCEMISQPQNTFLLTDTDGPFSLRTFEVISGVFAPYRDASKQDLAIQAVVSVPLPDTSSMPVADFTTSASSVCKNDSITFYCHTLNANNYSWIFENGTPSTSNLITQTVLYDSVGTWDVTLIVSNSKGNDTLIKTLEVLGNPVASFTTSSDTIYKGNAVSFTNNSIGAISYSWNFGDSTTSSTINPSHSYSNKGSYTVTLIASTPCGTDQKTKSIIVLDTLTPPASITEFSNTFNENQIEIYPNPSKTYLTMRFGKYLVNKLDLYDMTGKLILNQMLPENGINYIELNIESLQEGIYFIKALSNDTQLTSKFTIIR